MSHGDAPYDIHVEAKSVGDDIFAAVTGGTRAHIGAVAFAEPAGEQQEPSPCVSSISGFGHKDAVLAEMFAKGLCAKYGVNVCAAAGVHVDEASSADIELLLGNAEKLLARLTGPAV